jgi:hypothetical protein
MRAIPQSLLFCAGIVAGLTLWVGSSLFFGMSEPWDAEGLGYFGTLFVLGAIGGLLRPQAFWLAPAGLFVGQFLFGAVSWVKSIVAYSGGGVNFFVPLGAIQLFAFSLVALAGAFLGSIVSRASRRAP